MKSNEHVDKYLRDFLNRIYAPKLNICWAWLLILLIAQSKTCMILAEGQREKSRNQKQWKKFKKLGEGSGSE